MRARREWVGLKRIDVVETDVDGWRVDFYLEPKTRLSIKLVYGYSKIERARGEMSRVVQLEDYKDVSGVMMPHRLISSFTDGSEKSDQRARYELNVDYDEQIFEQAPTPGMKPDAWRRVARPLSHRFAPSKKIPDIAIRVLRSASAPPSFDHTPRQIADTGPAFWYTSRSLEKAICRRLKIRSRFGGF